LLHSINSFVDLINKQSYGVYLAHYLANNTFPGISSLQYAIIGGLGYSLPFLIAPFVTVSVRILGTRMTILIGIFLFTISLIGASFASRIWHLFLTQGVGLGLGSGFIFDASAGIPPQ
jgi:hypothetical protein